MPTPEQELSQDSKTQICVLCQREVVGDHPVCPFDGGPLITRKPDRLLGKKIQDKYEIIEIRSRGGMGVIYKAKHLLLERPVAIKCISDVLAYDKSMWKRFEQEAKSASLLNHPNIITVHDFGVTADGDLYLVMEYLEGASLNEFIELNGQLNEKLCARIFIQVCDALQHAHAASILHRDLKPSNIFISSTSRGPHVKVLDFGLAKVMHASTKEKITRTGECLGTPDYMSPEQTRGLSMDQRSDIYATGICMFEALTGKLPFSADDLLQVLSRQISDKAPTFKEVAPERNINKDMETIVMRCMEKDPAKRFQSMADLGAALSAYLQKHEGTGKEKTPNKIAENSKRGEKSPAKNSPPKLIESESASAEAAYGLLKSDPDATIAGLQSLEQQPKSPPARVDLKSELSVAKQPDEGKRESPERNKPPKQEPQLKPSYDSKISIVSPRNARTALFGFGAASIILIFTATAVLMPSKTEPPPAHQSTGILLYYNPDKSQRLAELDINNRRVKLKLTNSSDVKIRKDEGFQNGAIWNVSFHQGASGLEIDDASFSGSVDPLSREADMLVRRHYGQLGRKQWAAAYDNIVDNSGLRRSSFEEFKRGFKNSFHNPDSEMAPGYATKVASISDDKARVLLDMRFFSKGGSGHYAFDLVRKKGRWLISTVNLISESEWNRS